MVAILNVEKWLDFRQNFAYKKEALIWELGIQNPQEARSFGIAPENGHEMLAMERSNLNLEKRNVHKHVVILKEHLIPQYGHYGFALLRYISRDHVFGVWVRENYFWESGCKNFLHSEYFSFIVFWQRLWFFSEFEVFHVNIMFYDWFILHLIFLLIYCLTNYLKWFWEKAQLPNKIIKQAVSPYKPPMKIV